MDIVLEETEFEDVVDKQSDTLRQQLRNALVKYAHPSDEVLYIDHSGLQGPGEGPNVVDKFFGVLYDEVQTRSENPAYFQSQTRHRYNCVEEWIRKTFKLDVSYLLIEVGTVEKAIEYIPLLLDLGFIDKESTKSRHTRFEKMLQYLDYKHIFFLACSIAKDPKSFRFWSRIAQNTPKYSTVYDFLREGGLYHSIRNMPSSYRSADIDRRGNTIEANKASFYSMATIEEVIQSNLIRQKGYFPYKIKSGTLKQLDPEYEDDFSVYNDGELQLRCVSQTSIRKLAYDSYFGGLTWGHSSMKMPEVQDGGSMYYVLGYYYPEDDPDIDIPVFYLVLDIYFESLLDTHSRPCRDRNLLDRWTRSIGSRIAAKRRVTKRYAEITNAMK